MAKGGAESCVVPRKSYCRGDLFTWSSLASVKVGIIDCSRENFPPSHIRRMDSDDSVAKSKCLPCESALPISFFSTSIVNRYFWNQSKRERIRWQTLLSDVYGHTHTQHLKMVENTVSDNRRLRQLFGNKVTQKRTETRLESAQSGRHETPGEEIEFAIGQLQKFLNQRPALLPKLKIKINW